MPSRCYTDYSDNRIYIIDMNPAAIWLNTFNRIFLILCVYCTSVPKTYILFYFYFFLILPSLLFFVLLLNVVHVHSTYTYMYEWLTLKMWKKEFEFMRINRIRWCAYIDTHSLCVHKIHFSSLGLYFLFKYTTYIRRMPCRLLVNW